MSKPKVDLVILDELLEQPGVREHVQAMTPDELQFYKNLLISQGIYQRYVKERRKGRL